MGLKFIRYLKQMKFDTDAISGESPCQVFYKCVVGGNHNDRDGKVAKYETQN